MKFGICRESLNILKNESNFCYGEHTSLYKRMNSTIITYYSRTFRTETMK